ncbi:MAG TPA: sterol desaturase family protein [Cyclobacteriaceae bacterium]|jgi:sterol desaturase/sphingolipid hydroxylase (fatty acid hydroxylase superfamily)|nr:sterol desaturase family protein [Cyclobacteriaceae bacterium]
MEAYGKILLYAMPAFFGLVLFEKWYGWRKGFDTVRTNDMISSISSGVTNTLKDVLGVGLVIISYQWLVTKVALIHIEATWLVYFIAFMALDFAGYWVHRIQHEYNLFWNAHIVHHSSEEFNLACALRQSISTLVKVAAIFLLPAALLGVPSSVIAIVAPLHLFAQFWYHTRHIGRMGFLEKIIVTPSHHRVHHAINPEYLDRNYGQIFIFWDKLFGSYQEELPNVPPVYGVTRPVQTWNPIKINFMHLWLLIKDAWHAKSWEDKLKIWFMPLGWRPADVAEKFPVYKIKDVYHFEKYNPQVSSGLLAWSWIQMIMMLLLVAYLFGNIAKIGSPGMFWYGTVVFLMIYAFTELLDKSKYAIVWEFIKGGLALSIIYTQGDWFGISGMLPGAQYFIVAYFILSILVCAWWVYKNAAVGQQSQVSPSKV